MFLSLPIASSFAYPGGILDGKSLNFNTGGSSSLVTDNNTATYDSVTDTKYLVYDFEQSVSIRAYYVSFSTSYSTPKIVFYSGDTVVKTIYPAVNKYETVIVPVVMNVTKIVLTSQTSTRANIVEFDLFTEEVVNNDESKFIIENLSLTNISPTAITLNWSPVQSSYFKEYRIYQGSSLLGVTTLPSYSISGLQAGVDYSFKVTSVDVLDKEFTSTGSTIYYTPPLPDVTPPEKPLGVKVAADRYTAVVTWTASNDSDLDGYYVYLDGRLVSTLVKTPSFSLGNLKMDTDYEVYVQAVDKSGNKSVDSDVVKFKTLGLTTVPSAVYGLTGTPYSGSVSLNFSASPVATHYEIYMNGTKLMETKNTFTNIPNLNNGTAYTFYVVAVNSIGSAAPSNTVSVTPSAALPPNVTLGYGLQDVSNGVGTWFGGIWLILAFAISIPLAFFVGNRLKGFFAA